MLSFVSLFVAVHALAATPIEIGPDTTVVDGPVRADGTIDYIAAINATAGDGVRADENAFVGLLEVIPLDDWDESHVAGLYAALGLPRPAADDGRFVPWERYAQEHGLPPDDLDTARPDGAYGVPLERPWTRDEFPDVAAWLELNGAALDAVAEAVQRPKYYAPLVGIDEPPVLFEVLLPHLRKERAIARALANRTYLRLGEGDVDGALTDITALLDMGSRLRDEPLFIGGLVAISIHSLMREPLVAVLAHPRLDVEQAEALNRRFADRHPEPCMKKVIESNERYAMLDLMRHLDQGVELGYLFWNDEIMEKHLTLLVGHPEFDFNRALRRINGYYDKFAERMATEDYGRVDEIQAPIEKLFDDTRGGEPMRVIEATLSTGVVPKGVDANTYTDHVTDYVAGWMMLRLAYARRTEMQLAMLYDLHHLAVALAAYQRQHGRYPDALDALTPEYLDAVPVDFATGGPLHYQTRPDGYLLYSVGGDGEDDGGVDDIAEGDYVVAMPPAPEGE